MSGGCGRGGWCRAGQAIGTVASRVGAADFTGNTGCLGRAWEDLWGWQDVLPGGARAAGKGPSFRFLAVPIVHKASWQAMLSRGHVRAQGDLRCPVSSSVPTLPVHKAASAETHSISTVHPTPRVALDCSAGDCIIASKVHC